MEQSGFQNGVPVVPATTPDTTPTTTDPVAQLAEQVSQTQQALAQLVELNKAQMQSQAAPAPSIQKPEELRAEDLLNADTETGQYFLHVLQEREKKIVESVAETYEERLNRIESERMMENRLQKLAETNNIPEERVEGFKKWMSSPENVDMNTLYEVYNKVNPAQRQQQQAAQRMTSVGGATPPAQGKGFLDGLK